MNGIDSAIASLLASRVDSLLNIAPGATTAQTSASALDVETPVAPGAVELSATPASAQTQLSAVAQTLNAIALSGGDATPALRGEAPIWPSAPSLDIEIDALPLFDTLFAQNAPTGGAASGSGTATAAASASAPAGASNPASADPQAAAGAAATRIAASPLPIDALIAGLEQTVSGSGLFYESHLAQWLAGQLTPDQLAGEPQNRLLDADAQLSLDWSSDASPGGAAASAAPPAGRAGVNDANAGRGGAAPSIESPQAARFAAGEVLAQSFSELAGQPLHAALHAVAGASADAPAHTAQSMAGAVNAATIPLVRQQLDLLATGQFRWSGEAWPGAKLDWTIQQDGDEWQRSGGGASAGEDYPWRTRLTLSLPRLGTVDAELVLTGNRLAARVLASPLGAAWLNAQSDGFRQRLAAVGIDLHGLSIREIGGGAPGAASAAQSAADVQAAVSAYARAVPPGASAAGNRRGARPVRPAAAAPTDFDWDI
jgi:hypothetical protein